MFNLSRLFYINRFALSLILLLFSLGIVTLVSAGNGSIFPWAFKHLLKFLLASSFFIIVVATNIRWWFSYAEIIYFISLILLILVELMGIVGMGAKRWLDFYIITIQPSELMRISLIIYLAKYFSDLNVYETQKFKNLIKPLIIVFLPILLVLKQPDLGTAMMLLFSAIVIFFVSGVRIKFFVISFLGLLCLMPIFWTMLHDYQKQRILIFLNPELDIKNTGYHITQSKIALGSGGIFGKGWLHSTQGRLNFLPEKQTDFAFTMFGEEFGLFGCLVVFMIFALLISFGYSICNEAKNKFNKIVSIGITSTLFLYVFINAGMVMGLLPVVGVPMPFLSYGGNAMITIMLSLGILFSISLSKIDTKFKFRS